MFFLFAFGTPPSVALRHLPREEGDWAMNSNQKIKPYRCGFPGPNCLLMNYQAVNDGVVAGEKPFAKPKSFDPPARPDI